jgi:hypothetical protein
MHGERALLGDTLLQLIQPTAPATTQDLSWLTTHR